MEYEYYSKPDFSGMVKICCIEDLYKSIPEQNNDEFVWDMTAPVFSIPKKNKFGEWFIEINSSHPKIFTDYIKTYNEFGHLFLLCAIVPKAYNHFVGKSSSVCCSLYIPITCKPKTVELTHKEIEDKLGYKIKIVGE